MDPPDLPHLPPVRKGVDALMTGIPLAKGCQAMLPGASDRVRSLNRYSQFSGTMRAELFLARAGIARTMPGVPRARCPRPSGVLTGPEGLAYARCGTISRFSGTFHLAPPLSTTEHPLSNCSVIAQSLPSPVQKCSQKCPMGFARLGRRAGPCGTTVNMENSKTVVPPPRQVLATGGTGSRYRSAAMGGCSMRWMRPESWRGSSRRGSRCS